MSAAVVIDCSVAMAWCFADEQTPEATALLRRLGEDTALVPAWWRLEVTNVLAIAERKRRITPAQTAEFITLLTQLRIETDDDGPERAFEHLLDLCRLHTLTAYDSLYLDLALRRQLPLATFDEALSRAAAACGVELLKL